MKVRVHGAGLNLKNQIQHRQFAGRSRVAVVLLCVLMHGSLASALHHHSIRSSRAVANATRLVSGDHRGQNGSPLSDESANCATCNLQRTFNQALRWPAINFDVRYASNVFISTSRVREPASAQGFISARAPPLHNETLRSAIDTPTSQTLKRVMNAALSMA